MKRLKITVDGRVYDVTVEEIAEEGAGPQQPLPAAGTPAAPVSAARPVPRAAPRFGTAPEGTVVSPITGTVLKVLVTVGTAVKANDPVLKLEAMKLESAVVAPVSGTVKSIEVADGELVREGQSLLTIE
ncbi:MAG: biotin/lipoyl-binding protein [Hyphomicrobiales bacterium]|nr:biotin/lipoyl-binding protein [Hyphomicrobiales bacterium]